MSLGMLIFIILVLVFHWFGDFFCQTDWMALNKSKSLDALAVHTWAYLLLGLLPIITILGLLTHPDHLLVMWWILNGLCHFVQDGITSRITSRLWFIPMECVSENDNLWYAYPQMSKRHWFFVAIGADQLLHYVTLFVTAYLLLG